MSTRDDVIALIESWNLTLPKNWDRDTSLVRSGIIDSLALYQLILWIEEQWESRSIRRSSIWLTSWILSPASRTLWRKTVAADSTPRMVDGYEIVRYRPEHKSQVAKLQTHLWTSEPKLATRYLEWKYEENPYAKEPVIYLAFQGSKLVGMRGFYQSKWELGSPHNTLNIGGR